MSFQLHCKSFSLDVTVSLAVVRYCCVDSFKCYTCIVEAELILLPTTLSLVSCYIVYVVSFDSFMCYMCIAEADLYYNLPMSHKSYHFVCFVVIFASCNVVLGLF